MTDSSQTQPMDPEFRHVHPTMRAFLDIEGRGRLNRCWNKIWVPTSSTREAFVALEDCMSAPPSTKPRGLVLTGRSDTGKSRTMEAFRDRNPSSVDTNAEFARFPAIYISAPDKPSRTAVYKSILAAIGHPILYNASDEDLRFHTVRMMRGCKVGVVIIDELHDISRERMSNQLLEFLRFLKNLINETGRPFVIGGVPVVLDMLGQDEQIASRFDRVIELKPLKRDEFLTIVRAFDRLLPLRRPSCFRQDDAAIALLYDLSQGYIGRLSHLLHDACQIAIETGTESISLEILRKVPDRSIRSRTRNGEQ